MAMDFGAVVLGGNVFGWTVGETEAFALLDAFLEGGGKAIDTADTYPSWIPGREGGESETIIGRWMKARGCRSRIAVATKVAKWARQPGLSPKNIRSATEGSLRRLQTEYLDLYYAHQDDPQIPQAEYLEAFDALVKEGKVRMLGASNFSPARLASAVELSKKEGWAAFQVSQDEWNLVERGVEKELVPLFQRHGLKALPYFSLAKGFLTGKYRPGQPVASARASAASAYLEVPSNMRLLATLDQIAAEHQVSVAAIALAWLRAQPVVAAPIASARTPEQLGPLFEASKVSLTPDELRRLTTHH